MAVLIILGSLIMILGAPIEELDPRIFVFIREDTELVPDCPLGFFGFTSFDLEFLCSYLKLVPLPLTEPVDWWVTELYYFETILVLFIFTLGCLQAASLLCCIGDIMSDKFIF